MGKSTNPRGRTTGLVVQEFNGEILIYDLQDHRALSLNETAARVLQACNGENSVADISALVGDENITWLALEQLKKERLLDESFVNTPRFSGMSRRDVVKKIGVGALVALPLISGLVTPHAYAAGSACGTVAACDCGNNGNTNPCGQRTCSAGCTCFRTTGGASAGTCGIP
jgi:hypothetical protein